MVEVAEWKVNRVVELKELVLSQPLVGVASIDGIPSPQMQKMRAQLRGGASMVVSKNNLIARALKEASSERESVDGLTDLMSGQTALILGSGNPYALFQMLESAKVKAPAKGGEVAPEDIVVEEGDTPFTPGPIVGDLQRVGLPAAIEGGKVVIKKDHLLVKKGDRIPRLVAQVLAKLDIHPISVGPRLQGAYEDGTVYDRETLDVDVDGILGSFSKAVAQARHLAMETAYATPDTIRLLLTKARTQALRLATEAAIPTADTITTILQRASAQASALASRVPEASPVEAPEEE